MRTSLVILLALGLGVVLGGMFDGALRTAAAGPTGDVENGDVNGDGAINIADAQYLLNHLFLGGPALVPCSGSPGGEAELAKCQEDLAAALDALASTEMELADCLDGRPTGLPQTGQTACYDQNGNPIACTSGTCPGQDGLYRTGLPSAGRFVDNLDGTVTDTRTGLTWQKGSSPTRLRWCNALTYCENLSLAGHDDWRLPNIRELQSIVHYGRFQPAIDPVFSANPTAYWASTSISLGNLFPWWIDFTFGVTDAGDFDGSGLAYARAVRGP